MNSVVDFTMTYYRFLCFKIGSHSKRDGWTK